MRWFLLAIMAIGCGGSHVASSVEAASSEGGGMDAGAEAAPDRCTTLSLTDISETATGIVLSSVDGPANPCQNSFGFNDPSHFTLVDGVDTANSPTSTDLIGASRADGSECSAKVREVIAVSGGGVTCRYTVDLTFAVTR